ncbi:MAG: (E)-4-hydroxy-3-methylbut-2-enyl-diphosphate synthase [Tidjanibacter sp.]|nr:(E)-4-hydroxy-3-methylbut-2-enyl-diphosphate synthase [Tidjanibacter sp.]
MSKFCDNLFLFTRRQACEVRIGKTVIGGSYPVAVQTMTNRDTNDTEACVEQIAAAAREGCRIVRLTTQGTREARNLAEIAAHTHTEWPDVALVADVHFLPAAADVAAESADKVRINPGNYNDKGGALDSLLEKCARRGVALRIGVNHGSLSSRMFDLYGDTPEGMVASAMEYLRACRDHNFHNVVVSMKSSNVRVMIYAYRMLVEAMQREEMNYPLHLGVTEAGDGNEGRIKSAVGIGALLADGIGDTIRVSLTEEPEREVVAGRMLVDYMADREEADVAWEPAAADSFEQKYSPFEYRRNVSAQVGRVGGNCVPLLCSEMTEEERAGVCAIEAVGKNPVAEWRRAIARKEADGDHRPVMLSRTYSVGSADELRIKAAADFGVMFVDGLADAIDIRCSEVSSEELEGVMLDILQASRVRICKTEYISCPGCGRTLYDLQGTLAQIKERTSHLKGLKIGVMGCIVNGPGEMADADYGYVGAARGKVSLYRGKEVVCRNIPQAEALDRLVELIKADGRWTEQK